MQLVNNTSPFTTVQVAIFSSGCHCFDYKIPSPSHSNHIIGCRVRISLRKKTYLGMVVGTEATRLNQDQLLAVEEVIDDQPIISKAMMQLFHWVAKYYHRTIAAVIYVALPAGVCKGERLVQNQPTDNPQSLENIEYVLSEEQKDAVSRINDTLGSFVCHLLEGVTGSGKTEVYLQVAEQALARNQQVLILVPEISLIMQTTKRFQMRFGSCVTTYHSGLTNKQRHQCWNTVRESKACVVIGTRSAIFLPFCDVGLIVVDEEHDGSYKQDNILRYHARDVAIKRAQLVDIPIVLGSATPSLETLYNVGNDKAYNYLQLPQRVGEAKEVSHHIIDMRVRNQTSGLSNTLLEAIEQRLQKNEQVLLFLNRRGYAPAMICQGCRAPLECPLCDAYQVYHSYNNKMCCHHCGNCNAMPSKCPQCGHCQFETLGVGTERIEETLNSLFPSAGVLRFDRDVIKTKNQLERALDVAHNAQNEEAKILLGTQMLIKGHHFTNVTLVGVLNVDSSLFSADFRAMENLAQMIVQVSGRAGRGGISGDVMIQTHYPDNPDLKLLLAGDYHRFAQRLLGQREKAKLPPHERLAILYAESKKSEKPIQFLDKVFRYGQQITANHEMITLSQPIPAIMEKKEGFYRACILIVSPNAKGMYYFLNELIQYIDDKIKVSNISWSLDIDPIDMS